MCRCICRCVQVHAQVEGRLRHRSSGVPLAWNMASETQGSSVSGSAGLGLQVLTAMPGLSVWVRGVRLPALVLAGQMYQQHPLSVPNPIPLPCDQEFHQMSSRLSVTLSGRPLSSSWEIPLHFQMSRVQGLSISHPESILRPQHSQVGRTWVCSAKSGGARPSGGH